MVSEISARVQQLHFYRIGVNYESVTTLQFNDFKIDFNQANGSRRYAAKEAVAMRPWSESYTVPRVRSSMWAAKLAPFPIPYAEL